MTIEAMTQTLCTLREEYGYVALARDLGVDPDQAKALIRADWDATGDDRMYASVLDLGEAEIARRGAEFGIPLDAVSVSQFIGVALEYACADDDSFAAVWEQTVEMEDDNEG